MLKDELSRVLVVPQATRMIAHSVTYMYIFIDLYTLGNRYDYNHESQSSSIHREMKDT